MSLPKVCLLQSAARDAAGRSGRSLMSYLYSHSVPYAALTATFSKIEATTKRLEISAYLTRFLIDVIEKTPEDLLKTVYLCINRVRKLRRITRPIG